MVVSNVLPVFINRSGGTASSFGDTLEARLREAFAATERHIALEIVSADGIDEALQRHSGAPRIAVGGGDGTLGTAVSRVAERGGELAVLPLGTRNHFARQLGIPLDLAEAAALAADGHAVAVDYGTVGDRTFINNASLGAYAEMVRERRKSALPRFTASLLASWRVMWRLRSRQYSVVIDGESQSVTTPLLFVGNNLYEVSEGKPSERQSVHDGTLSVFALAPLGPIALLRAAFRIAFTKPDIKQDFALQTSARAVRIEGDGKVGVALDGEDVELALPLDITIHPGALKVVVPSD